MEKYQALIKNNEELKVENTKLSQENFNKFQKKVEIENELKIKSHKLEEVQTEKSKLKKI